MGSPGLRAERRGLESFSQEVTCTPATALSCRDTEVTKGFSGIIRAGSKDYLLFRLCAGSPQWQTRGHCYGSGSATLPLLDLTGEILMNLG